VIFLYLYTMRESFIVVWMVIGLLQLAKLSKKKKGISPLQRSKKLLEEQGYLVAIVERWNPWAKVRQDLFGILDLLCVGNGVTLGVQVTTLGHKQEHIDKMMAHPNLQRILDVWEVKLHSWRKLKDGWKVDIKDF